MRMKLNFERILIVEPHPDDGIVGAGGTIARIKRENPTCQIKLIYMSPCTEDPKNKGHIEDHRKVCKFLGIDEVIEESMPRDSYLEIINRKFEIFFGKSEKNLIPIWFFVLRHMKNFIKTIPWSESVSKLFFVTPQQFWLMKY